MYFKGNHTVNGLSNIPCLPSGFTDSPSSASTPQFRLFYGPWTILPGDPTGDPALEICQGRSEASPIVLTLSSADSFTERNRDPGTKATARGLEKKVGHEV